MSGVDLGAIAQALQDLKDKRETLNKSIQKDEHTRSEIEKRIAKLQDELGKLKDSLAQKQQARAEFDATINETEAAYNKITESAQTLMHVLRRETNNLTRKKGFHGEGRTLSGSEYKGGAGAGSS